MDSSTVGRPGEQGELVIPAKAHHTPSLIKMSTYNVGGTLIDMWLWFDGSGSLRCSNAIPTDQENDGNVVGP